MKNNLTDLTTILNDGIGHCFIRRQTKHSLIHRFLKVAILERFIFLPNCYIESGSESCLQHVFRAVKNIGQNQAVGGGGGEHLEPQSANKVSKVLEPRAMGLPCF